jgi:hypothetical protein
VPDVVALHDRLVEALGPDGDGGTFPAIAGLDPSLAGGVERACRSWLGWVSGQVAAPGLVPALPEEPVTWDRRRLEYRFALTATVPSGTVSLAADEYHGTGIDWYTFDRTDPVPAPPFPPVAPVSVRPTPVTYPGMPRPRFWELEDGEVNLDSFRAAGDAGRAILVAFAHQYANDWFLVPVQVPAGVTAITELTVTDTFGTATPVPAVAVVDKGRGPWRLWELTGTGGEDEAAAGLRLLPPPTPPPLQGPVLEEVLVARDELANLAWVIELQTMDRHGELVDRYQRYLRLRPASDPSFDPAGRANSDRYRLGTAIADHWYPLVADTAPDGRPVLTLADLPPGAQAVDDDGVAGRIVPHQSGTQIADEEVPREGIRLVRLDRLTLGAEGFVVWRARVKTPGRGEASPGLRFDILE